jgi:hypothetical protein
MNRPPSATRYTSTANRRPLLIEIALIAFVIAAIFVAALVGMSAALAADAAERAIPGVNSSGTVFERYEGPDAAGCPYADVTYVFGRINA